MATLILARNLVSTGHMNQISMKEDPSSPPRAVTECHTPCEIGLTKQGCKEIIYIHHPAVSNQDNLVSRIHEGEEEEVVVRVDGQSTGSCVT